MTVSDQEAVRFLQETLPRVGLKWAGFRNVRGTVRRRLRRRLDELQLDGLKAYEDLLRHDEGEWARLKAMCRIPISRFFRDRDVYRRLAQDVLPECARNALAAGRDTVRCLSAGCASGEEPYSVALVWAFRPAPRFRQVSLSVLGLDVDATMLQRAREGCYEASSLREVPDDIRTRAFATAGGANCLRAEFRHAVSFARGDLATALPDGPFDLILCRNTGFTYFSDAEQKALMARIDRTLRPGGYLVIGGHERLPCGGDACDDEARSAPVHRKAPAPGAYLDPCLGEAYGRRR